MNNFPIKSENESPDFKEGKNRNFFKKYLIFLSIFFVFLASFFIGYEKGKNELSSLEKKVSINEAVLENKLSQKDKEVDFSLFWKVWDLLKENHIDKDKLDSKELVYGAINGMLRATDDPYSNFFSPKESKYLADDIEGTFEGIGAELGIKDSILTIIAPLDDSPAQKAGLRAGDKILKVDDQIVADLTIDEAVELIRGKKGTEVKLTILQEGENETKEIFVTREKIDINNVKLIFKDDNIAHIKITKFSNGVDMDFNKAVNEFLGKKSQGVILDLRNNPGGLLDKSIKIASKMMPKGKIVVIEEYSSGKKENIYTLGGDKLSSIPIVVLINEGSASASEILAGALRDNQGAILIGEKSFGKGSVQQLMDLPGGSSVKITVAKWMTPNGEYIMEEGIKPDVEVELTLDDYNNDRDPQLEKALEIIKEKIEK
jgi:carboxyl-terminal processing protease